MLSGGAGAAGQGATLEAVRGQKAPNTEDHRGMEERRNQLFWVTPWRCLAVDLSPGLALQYSWFLVYKMGRQCLSQRNLEELNEK